MKVTMPWPRSELTIQAPNEFGLDLKVPWAQLLLRKRFIRVTQNEVWLNWTLDAWRRNAGLFFKNHPRHQTGSRHWSVVSCVRCGCVGAGLGFPVGDSRFAPVFHPQPPTNTSRGSGARDTSCGSGAAELLRCQVYSKIIEIPLVLWPCWNLTSSENSKIIEIS